MVFGDDGCNILEAYRQSSYPCAYGWGSGTTYIGWDFEQNVYVGSFYCKIRSKDYAVEYSDDKINWTSVYTSSGWESHSYGTDIDIPISNSIENGAHRYWRIRIISSNYKPMMGNLHFRIMY